MNRQDLCPILKPAIGWRSRCFGPTLEESFIFTFVNSWRTLTLSNNHCYCYCLCVGMLPQASIEVQLYCFASLCFHTRTANTAKGTLLPQTQPSCKAPLPDCTLPSSPSPTNKEMCLGLASMTEVRMRAVFAGMSKGDGNSIRPERHLSRQNEINVLNEAFSVRRRRRQNSTQNPPVKEMGQITCLSVLKMQWFSPWRPGSPWGSSADPWGL